MSNTYPWDEKDIIKSMASLSMETHNTTYFASVLKVCSCTPALIERDQTASVIGTYLNSLCDGLIYYRFYRVLSGPPAYFLLLKPRTQDKTRSYVRVFLSGLQLKLQREYGIISAAAVSRPLTRACPLGELLAHLLEMTEALNLFALNGQPHIIKDYPKGRPFTLPVYPPALSCSDEETAAGLKKLVGDALSTIRIRQHLTLSESCSWIDTVIRQINRQLPDELCSKYAIPGKGSLRDKWYNYSTFEEFCLQNHRLLGYPERIRESLEYGY